MEAEFKVGDRVRCTNVDGDYDHSGIGDLGTVDHIVSDTSWQIRVLDDKTGLLYAYDDTELELVDNG